MAENVQKNNITEKIKKSSGMKRLWPLLPELLIVIGIISIGYSITHNYYRSQALKVNESIIAEYEAEKKDTSHRPVEISIPWFVDTSIREDVYQDGEWTLSEETASFLAQSAYPGEEGNIIIYGHNKREILGNIRALTGNEIITIITENGDKHHYKINLIKEVNPTEVQYLQPTDEETLTLYTCSGFMDSKRFIVQATPIESNDSL